MMPELTKTEAMHIIEDQLKLSEFPAADGGLVIVLDHLTIEKPYGWVFFINTLQFMQTRDRHYSLVRAGPIIVEKSNGRPTRYGTAASAEKYIEEYERERQQTEGSAPP